ncbi:MAG: endonuclease/exonuclease/phosphatase family protein [Aquabacterium sp.]|uniref:endonuclease/exonuclease/phosphatase family protein n=1 Tax=Aquabacterium sp. TaxID=1872578 RepID=UPI002716EBF6|nr:endonuclease/exonuclease/phosphatase family protein [Aquabacterium sp.]MDO9001931.1 endonuclease/exonuclease/phosphatase family protein [Aquabacterium sp.]
MERTRKWWQSLGQWVVAAVAVGLLLVWLGLSNDPESHAALALLLYVPYPVYLVPAVLALIWSLSLGWRWRVLAMGSVLFVLTVLMRPALGSPDDGYRRVRLMTYNIKAYLAVHRPTGVADLAMEVLQHDPDVVVLQDAGQLLDVRYTPPTSIKTILGQREVYAFGQYIVASRFPMKGCLPGWIPYNGQNHSYVHCVISVNGTDFDLVTVHFVTPRDGLNAARSGGVKGLGAWRDNMNKRLTQSGVLAEHLRLMKRPRVVAGDLNAPENSSVVQDLLDTGLRDAFASAGLGYGYTHGHSLWPGISFLRIDHILVSEEIGVSDAFVGGKVASQHRPVIADLLLVRQP